ncbi:MAG: patatin-like phospholipase family protein, partial [Actinomycetota bacterium]|nr:patatin-like phospholipase family protein [Actinomycetota bacterium]
MPDAGKELRLALAMRGGVSLAVWIGGVCAEIDELLRAGRGGAAFWSDRLGESKFERVVVDVLAGASAGGLNGVLFASSIRFGFPMARMRQIWNEVGDIDGLRREQEPWTSVLDGDGVFLPEVFTRLTKLASEPQAHKPPCTFLDLRLSATLVEPVVMSAVGPDDEQLTRARSSATFHFRYSDGVPVPSDDFSGGSSAIRRLALAARATASFPGAFEPAIVRSNRPRAFGTPVTLVDGPLVDCGEVFSERNGAHDSSATAAPSDFLVADGGIVDNIPLGKAIEAVSAAPAEGPTKRYLLYLHPSGPEAMRPTSPGDTPLVPIHKRRRVDAVGRGFRAARLAGESIEGDIRALEAQSGAANLARGLRQQALASLAGTPITEVAARQLPAYTVQRAVVGAAYLRRM